jgi:hypothetical protein
VGESHLDGTGASSRADEATVFLEIDKIRLEKEGRKTRMDALGDGPFRTAGLDGKHTSDFLAGLGGSDNIDDRAFTLGRLRFNSRGYEHGSLIYFRFGDSRVLRTRKIESPRLPFDRQRTTGGNAFARVAFADGDRTAIFSGGNIVSFDRASGNRPHVLWMHMTSGYGYYGTLNPEDQPKGD